MQADVFSFGVVLYELLTLERPWRNHGMPENFVDFLAPGKVVAGERLEVEKGLNPDFRGFDDVVDLMSKCFTPDPDERPLMTDIFNDLVSLKSTIENLDQQPEASLKLLV